MRRVLGKRRCGNNVGEGGGLIPCSTDDVRWGVAALFARNIGEEGVGGSCAISPRNMQASLTINANSVFALSLNRGVEMQ